jgi:branched-chain amino acid transport system substrate-binding protein
MNLPSIGRRAALAGGAALAMPFASARAQSPVLRIGVLNDMSGTYRDATGPTSAACARQAVEDFKAAGGDLQIEVLTGDHQNKPDVGLTIARQWMDQGGVDMILDVPTSSVALAVNTAVKERNKAYVNCGGATTDLTGKDCTPNLVHWSYDTTMLAVAVGGAVTKGGADTWYFVTADYVFGHQLQRDTTEVVEKLGGKVLGAAAYPFPTTTDFSSYLLQAQASGAKAIGLANAGDDTVNCVKQAHEFGLMAKGIKLAALLGSATVVHGIGLEVAQGLILTESFYWDLNDRTRAFTKRVVPKAPNAALPESLCRNRDRPREGGRIRGDRVDEGDRGRRRRVRQDEDSRRRAGNGDPVFVRGEKALGEQRRMGCLQRSCHRPAERRRPAARCLSACEGLRRFADRGRRIQSEITYGSAARERAESSSANRRNVPRPAPFASYSAASALRCSSAKSVPSSGPQAYPTLAPTRSAPNESSA